MSPTFVFFNANVIIAVLVFATIALTEPFLEKWLHDLLQSNPQFCFGWDHFFSPLLRSTAIVLFVYIAYPGIFGITDAPTLGTLSADANSPTSSLIGLMFLLGLLLPLIPFLNQHPEFVLPIQGCLAVAYVFSWLTNYLHITTAYIFPDLDILICMLLISYLGHRLAQRLARTVGNALDDKFSTRGLDVVTSHIVELLVQIPVILTYGYGIGRQLSM